MARKKEPAKPLFAVKHDFVDAMENVSQMAIMLIQACEFAVRNDGFKSEHHKVEVEKCTKALRAAMFTDE